MKQIDLGRYLAVPLKADQTRGLKNEIREMCDPVWLQNVRNWNEILRLHIHSNSAETLKQIQVFLV